MTNPSQVSSRSPIRQFGDFEIRREIGRGGMGTVYEAWQGSLQRTVALKIMAGHIGSSPSAVLRFQREAQAAAKLQHANIIPIFGQGDEDGVYFYAMELVQGRSLNQVIANLRERTGIGQPVSDAAETMMLDRSGSGSGNAADSGPVTVPVPSTSAGSSSVFYQKAINDSQSPDFFRAIAHHMAAVADALDYAHKRGVIHRDIKPHNLMLGDDGRMRVSDFGLARMMEQPGVTITGELMGSPLYMSPEQIVSGPGQVDHRTDIYSLGATLYEWLTLRTPYPGETRERVISLLLTSEVPNLRTLNQEIPVDLETVCLKAIERDRARRYQNAGDLRDDLQRFLDGRTVLAKRAGMVVRTRKFVGRHPLATLTAAAALIALTLTVALFNSKRNVHQKSVALQEKSEALEKQQENNKQLVEGTNRIWSMMRTASGVLPPEIGGIVPVAERMRPVVQGLMESGQKVAASAVDKMATNPNAATSPFTPQGIALRVANDLYASLRPHSPSTPDESQDIVTQLLADAVSLWPQNVQASLAIVEKVLRVRKDDFDARHLHTSLVTMQRDFDGLKSDADELIRIRATDPVGYLWRGIGRLMGDDAIGALVDFSRANEMRSDLPWTRVLRGLALVRLGKFEDAIGDYNQVLAASPDLVAALMARANAYRTLGSNEQAVADLTHAIALEPENADALAARGEVYIAMANYADSAADFNRAVDIVGNNPAMLLPFILEQQNRLRNATTGSEEAAKIDTSTDANAKATRPSQTDNSSAAFPSPVGPPMLRKRDGGRASTNAGYYPVGATGLLGRS